MVQDLSGVASPDPAEKSSLVPIDSICRRNKWSCFRLSFYFVFSDSQLAIFAAFYRGFVTQTVFRYLFLFFYFRFTLFFVVLQGRRTLPFSPVSYVDNLIVFLWIILLFISILRALQFSLSLLLFLVTFQAYFSVNPLF